MVTFETLLNRDVNWALDEADRYFAERGSVHQTLRRLANRFDELGVGYAVIGAVAMFYHGFRRFTEDVDILLTPAGLELIDNNLIDSGYLRPSDWRRGFRDIETGVAIHVMVAGTLLGHGHLGNTAIPDPRSFTVYHDGLKILALPKLLELKFWLGSVPSQLRHLGDAQALIRDLDLPLDYAEELAPEFRKVFAEYSNYAQLAEADDY